MAKSYFSPWFPIFLFVLIMLALLSPQTVASLEGRVLPLGLAPSMLTGAFYSGHASYGCNPPIGQNECFAPALAEEIGYLRLGNGTVLVISSWLNAPYVNWQPSMADGQPVTVSGTLVPIFYNSTPGSSYPVYSMNCRGHLNPQPQYQIEQASFGATQATTTYSTTTSVSCTNTITVTLTSGQPYPPLAVPAPGNCYAFVTVGQQTATTAITTPQTQTRALCPIGWSMEANGNCVPPNPILDAWSRLWNWLRCLFGYC